ncbi:MAG: matrixin family metalloprotease [Bdellovibrionota bacterium]
MKSEPNCSETTASAPTRYRARVSLHALFSVFLCLTFFSFAGCGHDEERNTASLGSGNLRWNSFPVSLKVDSSIHDGGAADEDLLAAVSFWETHAGKTLFTLGTWPTAQPPYTGPAQDPDDLLDNAVFFLSPWPFDAHIAGKTTIHSIGPSIQKAVIFLNSDTALCSGLCDQPGDDLRTSRRRLLAHEMGHFLGFDHVGDRDNIMYPEIVTGGSLEDRKIDQSLLNKLTTSP